MRIILFYKGAILGKMVPHYSRLGADLLEQFQFRLCINSELLSDRSSTFCHSNNNFIFAIFYPIFELLVFEQNSRISYLKF